MTTATPTEFDVFLSHNGRDKPVVEKIGEWLKARGLRVWLDVWELRPGFPWQAGLEEAVRASGAVAVCVGAGGLGAWQEPEMRAFITRSRREQVPVIPVLLPDCPDSPQLNLFLEAFTWVDLRPGLSEDGLTRLVWGITGERPPGPPGGAAIPRRKSERPRWLRWSGAIALSVLGVVATLATWLWPRPPGPVPGPARPAIYAVRVQVLDPQGGAVTGAKVRTSAGNEPLQRPDGWWQIEIPAAKVPVDGRVTLWAEHPEWRGSRVELTLGRDPNPRAELQLQEPQSFIRGRVTDGRDRALAGVRITRQDGGPGEATTDGEGRFELKLAVPPGPRVGLRAEYRDAAPKEVLCYAGGGGCTIIFDSVNP